MEESNINPKVHSLKGSVSIHVSVSAEVDVITYPHTLLETCKGLIEDEQFGISIIVAHMACEVATERSFSSGFLKTNIKHLETPILEFMNGFNLSNEKNRKLYNALTGDSIEKQPFWLGFKESAIRRNNIIHNGKQAKKKEAESTFHAANEIINYLGQ